MGGCLTTGCSLVPTGFAPCTKSMQPLLVIMRAFSPTWIDRALTTQARWSPQRVWTWKWYWHIDLLTRKCGLVMSWPPTSNSLWVARSFELWICAGVFMPTTFFPLVETLKRETLWRHKRDHFSSSEDRHLAMKICKDKISGEKKY